MPTYQKVILKNMCLEKRFIYFVFSIFLLNHIEGVEKNATLAETSQPRRQIFAQKANTTETQQRRMAILKKHHYIILKPSSFSSSSPSSNDIPKEPIVDKNSKETTNQQFDYQPYTDQYTDDYFDQPVAGTSGYYYHNPSYSNYPEYTRSVVVKIYKGDLFNLKFQLFFVQI